ncbi:MAG: energy transducer TonB [Flavobacteriales bacterium]|nr:energy transducer TonB [Flavobacteriales bacterium]
MLLRSVGIGVCLLLLGSVWAQSEVAPLGTSSDAGQRVFDQRIKRTAAPADTSVYDIAAVDVAPVYPGGHAAMLSQLAKAPGCMQQNWNADGLARTKVMLRFVVEANGKVSQLGAEGESDEALRRHALCAARTLQPFTPGTKGGKPVRTVVRVPVQYEPR